MSAEDDAVRVSRRFVESRGHLAGGLGHGVGERAHVGRAKATPVSTVNVRNRRR